MARLRFRALLALALAVPAPADEAGRAAAAVEPVAIVASPTVSAAALDADEVRRIFLMRRRYWDDGSLVQPVNLPADSPLRIAFSTSVLGSTPRRLADYFNELYFHGTRPPAVVESERAVLLFVQRTPGAIGYVSMAALAGLPPTEAAGVRILATLELD